MAPPSRTGSVGATPMIAKAMVNSTAAPASSATTPNRARSHPRRSAVKVDVSGGRRDHQAALPGAEAELALEVHRQGGEEQPEDQHEDDHADRDRAEHVAMPDGGAGAAELVAQRHAGGGPVGVEAPVDQHGGGQPDGVRARTRAASRRAPSAARRSAGTRRATA